jgi:hypothetical protein
MCIITKSDLNRIYDNLERRQRDKDDIRQELERKKELAERSAQITKNWPNTITVKKFLQNIKRINFKSNFSLKGCSRA